MKEKIVITRKTRYVIMGALFVFWLVFMVLMTRPAHAQTVCTDRGAVGKQLAVKYKEAPVAIGLTSSGGVIEVFASEDGSTWTLIITMTDGTSCLIAAGESWERLPHKLKKYIGDGA